MHQALPDFEHLSADLNKLIDHLQHILPAQAPLQDFVHHNTLHGFQHLEFPDAVKQAEALTGNMGYLSLETFREYYQQGRITDADLFSVLKSKSYEHLSPETVIFQQGEQRVRYVDIYHILLLHPIKNLSACQLTWQIEEQRVLEQLFSSLDDHTRKRLLANGGADEQALVADLWAACLEVLGLEHYVLHPEELVDLSTQHAERMFNLLQKEEANSTNKTDNNSERLLNENANKLAQTLFSRVGKDLTLHTLVEKLTGENAAEQFIPLLIRYASSWLDQGVAAWQPDDQRMGFYQAWKQSEQRDLLGLLNDMPDWYEQIESLPDNAVETIHTILTRMGIPAEDWTNYLQNVTLSLPGWSGMFLWRHHHPHYEGHTRSVDMTDYLAVCLVMEYLFVQQLCRKHWLIDASLFDLKTWLVRHKVELFVRYHLFQGDLPEYLIAQAQDVLLSTRPLDERQSRWLEVGQRVWTWQHSPAAIRPEGYSVSRAGWRLFSLMQRLGIVGKTVRRLQPIQIKQLLACLNRMDQHEASFLWLQAYEQHYHDSIFNAVQQNHRHHNALNEHNFRGEQPSQAEAQLIFCMDDREESTRRHLEEINPNLETFGAAAFFSIIMNWKGIDDEKVSALCPVVAIPEHQVTEIPHEGQDKQYQRYQKRQKWRLWIKNIIHQETRRNTLTSTALILASTPFAIMALITKIARPLVYGQFVEQQQKKFAGTLKTKTDFQAEQILKERGQAHEHNQHGFTDEEQADRVEAFLRNIGLVKDYAPFVVVCGHGSISQNNPHRAAYDCGACSGRNSGPNARVFAAMANRPIIRTLLRERGLPIPSAEHCWFLGSVHNTADEEVVWFDNDQIPTHLRPAFEKLQRDVIEATRYSAQERCRKLASAPKKPSLAVAYDHVIERTHDISQIRPELGHITNAVAFIGRRALSRGVFWDRRAFLISYDCTTDPEGTRLEGILLSAGPVGAGINLEYYFSAVDNENYGCGPKSLHNVAGLFGVMEGASSDLRTGLPYQMIDIHEAMRLQVLVEAKVEVLTEIYQRQPPLQELIGKGWILLSAKDPDSDDIFVFKPDQGFVPWQDSDERLPQVDRSRQWYWGQQRHLPPAHIQMGKRSMDGDTMQKKTKSAEGNHA